MESRRAEEASRTPDPADMRGRPEEAAGLLRAIAQEGRLAMPRHPAAGGKSVSELEVSLSQTQAAVGQPLARSRPEGLVDGRRDGRTIRYSPRDPGAARRLGLVRELFPGLRQEEETKRGRA